ALLPDFSLNPPAPPPAQPPELMPGRYPGRVIEVRHPGAVSPAHRVDAGAVGRMVDRGMAALTGVDDPRDVAAAWGPFFQKGDVVGIKVNPVGRAPRPGEGRNPNAVGAISSPELLVKVVECLKEVGIPAKDIIVFERYADEFERAGYLDLMRSRPLDGVRW